MLNNYSKIDKKIKELFHKNGIKLSLAEKLFGIKEWKDERIFMI